MPYLIGKKEMTRIMTAATTPAPSQIDPDVSLLGKVSRLFRSRAKAGNEALDQRGSSASRSDLQHAKLSALTMRWTSEEGRLQAVWRATERDAINVNESQPV